MIHKVVIDAVHRALNASTLYVNAKFARKDGFRLETEFNLTAGITMLLGPSGAGKTTLLDCIAGLVQPNRGRIVEGQRVLFDNEERIDLPARERRCGYLFQDLALFPHLTVQKNVAYGLAHLSRVEREERVEQILCAFRIQQLAGKRPSAISGGEQQRVAIARALVTEPAFLLLDEPLTALDPETKTRIVEDLRALNAEHRIPILYVTHDRHEAYALGERVLALESGRIVAEGTPQEVLEAPRRETVAQLAGFENVFDVSVQDLYEDYGTMMVRLLPVNSSAPSIHSPKLPRSGAPEPKVTLEVPLLNAERGERLRLGIRAGDILVSLERPTGLSARNLLPVEIVSLRREGTTMRLEAESTEEKGIRFQVHLTPRAVEGLNLNVRDMVWLVLKTHSCHLMRD